VPEPVAGEPPGANQNREVTVPVIEAEQLMDWPTCAGVGAHVMELIVGRSAAATSTPSRAQAQEGEAIRMRPASSGRTPCEPVRSAMRLRKIVVRMPPPLVG